MSFLSFSDIHIKNTNDPQYQLLIKALNSSHTEKVNKIFFLGDIFDLLVGSKVEYVDYYQEFFLVVQNLLEAGKEIYFFEGNHDFHFKNLLRERYKIFFDNNKLQYLNSPLKIKIAGKNFLFCHGDEIDLENRGYQFYKWIIRSRFIQYLADDLVSFNFISKVGHQASNNSKKRNSEKYGDISNLDFVKSKSRRIFEKLTNQLNIHFLICGHSHCLDHYSFNNAEYLNNGFFPITKSCIYFNGKQCQLIELD